MYIVSKDSVWLCVVVRAWSFVVVHLLDGPVIRCRDKFVPAIRRAVIFDVDFVTNGGHCVNRIAAVHTHTFTYTHICVQISYKHHFLRIRKYGTRRAALRIASFITTSGKIFTVDKYCRDSAAIRWRFGDDSPPNRHRIGGNSWRFAN